MAPNDQANSQKLDVNPDLALNKPDIDLEKDGDDDNRDLISNLVTWDGPSDPTDPRNWSFTRKWLATILLSLITFMTPITSSLIAPASNAIGNELGVHQTIQLQIIFSRFLLAYVVGPFILAPLSEVYGHAIVLQLANLFLTSTIRGMVTC